MDFCCRATPRNTSLQLFQSQGLEVSTKHIPRPIESRIHHHVVHIPNNSMMLRMLLVVKMVPQCCRVMCLSLLHRQCTRRLIHLRR